MSKYFVLAFDGGGCRSVVQWTIFKRIMREFPNLLSIVDVFTGTSAGSILAAGIVAKLNEHHHHHHYQSINKMSKWEYVESELDKLFTKETIESIFELNPKSSKLFPSCLRSVFRAEYSHANLFQMLQLNFGDAIVADLKRTIYIPVYAINNNDISGSGDSNNSINSNNVDDLRCNRWHISSFHNLGQQQQQQQQELKKNHEDVLLSVAVQASCSAPTYFGLTENFCDGGVWANNPSLAVTTEMINRGVDINDIYVLNIGSGETPTELNWPNNSEPGLLKWAPDIVTMILDANQEGSTWVMKHILGKERYFRIQPLLEEPVALDNVSKFDYLVQKGYDEDLTKVFNWIRENIV